MFNNLDVDLDLDVDFKISLESRVDFQIKLGIEFSSWFDLKISGGKYHV